MRSVTACPLPRLIEDNLFCFIFFFANPIGVVGAFFGTRVARRSLKEDILFSISAVRAVMALRP